MYLISAIGFGDVEFREFIVNYINFLLSGVWDSIIDSTRKVGESLHEHKLT